MARDGWTGRGAGSRRGATGPWESRARSAGATRPRGRARSLLCSPCGARQLREGNVDVGARLRRQSEHALADDVPLDLVRAAQDRDGGAGEEQRLPTAVAAAID